MVFMIVDINAPLLQSLVSAKIFAIAGERRSFP